MPHVLPAYGADFNLLRAFHTSTDVPAVVEKRIDLFRIANLTHVAFLVRYFPVGNALAPPFAILKTADVLVTRPFLEKRPLAVLFVLEPGPFVDVAVLEHHLALGSRAFAGDERAIVGLTVG